jgi:hypothetical protein
MVEKFVYFMVCYTVILVSHLIALMIRRVVQKINRKDFRRINRDLNEKLPRYLPVGTGEVVIRIILSEHRMCSDGESSGPPQEHRLAAQSACHVNTGRFSEYFCLIRLFLRRFLLFVLSPLKYAIVWPSVPLAWASSLFLQ